MIIGNDREAVIENIKNAVESEAFYRKVELDDPILTDEKALEICQNYLYEISTVFYKVKSFFAKNIANALTKKINADTEVVIDGNVDGLDGGFIVTSNHFSPLENTCVRFGLWAIGIKNMAIVSQVGNFAMNGLVGFLMNYANTIPIHKEHKYLSRDFVKRLEECFKKKQAVLIYPEEEMWFNYKKPRPLKSGAYYFAAKLGVPVLSMLVEMIDTDEKEQEHLYRVRYRVHILGVIRPDGNKSVRENCDLMCQQDYNMKKDAYERAYGKKLTYDFDASDIGGYKI